MMYPCYAWAFILGGLYGHIYLHSHILMVKAIPLKMWGGGRLPQGAVLKIVFPNQGAAGIQVLNLGVGSQIHWCFYPNFLN